MKKNLIFLHIAKNGGSTMHAILERLFAGNSFTIRANKQSGLNTEEFTSLSEQQRRQIKLLKGHMAFGLHEYLYGDSEYITFLRKPTGRILSYYQYVLSRPSHELHELVSKEGLSLDDFVQHRKLNSRQDFNNAQVKKISGIQDKPQFMLEKALENIEKHFSFAGLLERYDESLVLLKCYYNWPIPYYRVRNKTNSSKPINQVDTKTTALINELNREDCLLYEAMEKQFEQQIEKVGKNRFTLELFKLQMANKLISIRYLQTLKSTLRSAYKSSGKARP